MRVALVHDWLTGMRGGERVLEALISLFPASEIFTLFHLPGSVSAAIEARPIHTSFLQAAPGLARGYRRWLPLFPLAARALPIEGFDLVVSSSHCVAAAVRTGGTPHLCYCHTPMRYAWEPIDPYLPSRGRRALRPAASLASAALRRWDAAAARGVDAFIANSANVRERIHRAYGRAAAVVHPGVELGRFAAPRAPEDFYLVLGALVPYKRVDLAIRACALLGRRLLVAGVGPHEKRLRAMAGPGTELLGRVSDLEAADLYARCRALLLPGVEDFGITPVEAHAAGAPVLALAAGGALETVAGPVLDAAGRVLRVHDPAGSGPTGVLFDQPAPAALAAAILAAERMRFPEATLRASAARFSPARFAAGILAAVDRLVEAAPERRDGRARPRPATTGGRDGLAAGAA